MDRPSNSSDAAPLQQQQQQGLTTTGYLTLKCPRISLLCVAVALPFCMAATDATAAAAFAAVAAGATLLQMFLLLYSEAFVGCCRCQLTLVLLLLLLLVLLCSISVRYSCEKAAQILCGLESMLQSQHW
jgi:hypothetical protein